MQAREFLWQYQSAVRERQRLKWEIKAIEDELTSISSPSFDGMPKGSGITDKMAEGAARLEEKSRALGDAYIRAQETFMRIEAVVALVPDPVQRQVLTLRYISRMKWEDIAIEVAYSYRHLERIHGEALAAVQAILEQ